MWKKYAPCFQADGGAGGGAAGGAGDAGAAGAAGGTAGAAAGAAGGAATPWHQGKVDADTLGFWQNKGYDLQDPVKVALGLTEQYRNAEKLIGVPANEMVRVPKANASEADVKAFWSRIGVPGEAKDYDFSGIKAANGQDLDGGWLDMLRTSFLDARVPKDRAAGIVKRLVDDMAAKDTATAADRTAYVQKQQDALKTNWGNNFDGNMFIAKTALEKLGAKAGMNGEQVSKAWDALSKVGGVDASHALEILRVAGVSMGEGRYISNDGGSGDPAMLSREAALQEINALKKDTAFGARLLGGDRESRRKWDSLHQVAYGRAA